MSSHAHEGGSGGEGGRGGIDEREEDSLMSHMYFSTCTIGSCIKRREGEGKCLL